MLHLAVLGYYISDYKSIRGEQYSLLGFSIAVAIVFVGFFIWGMIYRTRYMFHQQKELMMHLAAGDDAFHLVPEPKIVSLIPILANVRTSTYIQSIVVLVSLLAAGITLFAP